MEIRSAGIQSYQNHQTQSDAAAATGSNALAAVDEATLSNETDDRVSLSRTRQIFEWLAQEFPALDSDPETFVRLNQQLFDYGIFSLKDMQAMNTLMTEWDPSGLAVKIRQELSESDSYQRQQTLVHIQRVYANLDASRRSAA